MKYKFNYEFENLRKALELVAEEFADRYQNKLIGADKLATEKLATNISYTIHIDDKTYDIVLNLKEYWKYVEYGRRKGAKRPPIKAIRDWIEVKGILPRATDKLSLEQAKRALPYAIANSISKNGIKPTYFVRDTKAEVMNDFKTFIGDALKQDVKYAIEKRLKSIKNIRL